MVFLAGACNPKKEKELPKVQAQTTYAHEERLIEAQELLDLEEGAVKIIDFRKPEAFASGHIKGALNLGRGHIEDRISYPYRGMKAKKKTVENLLSDLGIGNEDTLIVYDDSGATGAARFWWVLKTYGFDAVRILNGGLKAWTDAGGALSTEGTQATATSQFNFPENGSAELWVGKDEMLQLVSAKGNEIIVDARSPKEHAGMGGPTGSKPNNIPGSINIEWREAIDSEDIGKFKPYKELERIYAKMGAGKEDPIVVYCQSGVRSAHTTFVLTQLLGYKNVRNYDGSWAEWSYLNNLTSKERGVQTLKK